ncbi:MAG: chromosome segregation protein SMC [Gammaproteobacteria bacterium]|nr:chromosome segregation protein SMC [Gammaproteobacteria bacterium]
MQAIKLAGFKSFVDPTTVPFPSNLCAVVGPNGCGKSNIIDAVRWVMGESSAKTLRGESMADVIFNGSTSRKPVGQASIELIFDNTEGRLTGEYAAYNEISIKRQVTRDGQSNYFLNGQKCRRKDITDIFLGTGLGPRSYSIIEQGMISQLIEAKPEDLRVYIEEAAGISKYKERRKETERRIVHTRDNLDRLNDLREELDRQLHHLERQAKAAERYTELKAEEREVQAQLQALRWKGIDGELKSKSDNIARLENEREARVADQRRLDAEIEQKRADLVELSDQINEVQKRYYDHGTEIARVEDSIQYQNERRQQLAKDLEEVNQNWYKIRGDIDGDQRKLGELQNELASAEPKQSEVKETEDASSARLQAAEEAMRKWQEAWDEFNQSAAEARNQGEVQQSRIESLEESIERLNSRIRTLRADVERMEGETVEGEIEPLESMLSTQEAQVERIEAEITELNEKIEEQRVENDNMTALLDEKRSELQSVRGRYSSLEALQQAALGQDSDEVSWLEKHGLRENARLGEKLKVDEGWELAVETALGDHLQAICVDGVDSISRLLGDFEKGALRFVASQVVRDRTADDGKRLADKIKSDVDLTNLLAGIQIADTLEAALARRGSLEPGESVITPEGLWIGPDWLRISKDHDATAGVISRQGELEHLAADRDALTREVESLTTSLDEGQSALKVAETDREQAQARLAEQQRAYSETRGQLGAKKLQVEQLKSDLARANREIESSLEQLEQDEENLKKARHALTQAMDQMESDTHRREQLVAEREEKQNELEAARSKAREDRDTAHQLALRVQQLKSEISSTEQAMNRLKEQQTLFEERKQSIESSINESEEPQAHLKQELESQLEARLKVENELSGLRQQAEGFEHEIREREQSRSKIDEEIEQTRSSLDQVKMDWQRLEVRATTITEQLEADKQDLATVLANLPEEANEADWDEKLTKIGNRIQRLGRSTWRRSTSSRSSRSASSTSTPRTRTSRRHWQTLESAIRKIDIETRTKFKETFDLVNAKLQQLFPKLFGGGHAYLEMTGEDLLDTGITLMARPPGKRNTSIAPVVGRREGADGDRTGVFDLQPESGTVLFAGRGRRAAG